MFYLILVLFEVKNESNTFTNKQSAQMKQRQKSKKDPENLFFSSVFVNTYANHE